MKKIITTFLFLACIQLLHAQNPLVKKWDFRFGGTELDFVTCFQQTADGGYILGGFSKSPVSGDKTSDSKGGYDYWVVKIDPQGTKEWDMDFGGLYDERLFALQQTSDGGYILGGSSSSGIGGDKTQNNRDTVNFTHDYWVIKIDALGNKVWDKVYGGIENENLFSLQQTSDGGFIFGGFSYSGIGGDKTEANHDTTNLTHDYWVVKTDSAGNMQWDKRYGGIDDDQLTSVRQASDGGYLLAGASVSDSSGDKTQPSKGNYDFWVIKTDPSGVKQWDYTYGGTELDILYSMQPTSDNGFILGGTSKSGASGDKTGPNWDNTNVTSDYWIVKLDELGAKKWDRVYGGVKDEFQFGNISQTSDGGYLLSGISYSDISGNKTENNLGVEQSWVVKTDTSGVVQWDKTLYTAAEDECGYAIQTKDGCYVMTNSCPAGIGGYKSQQFVGLEDYWIVKFCDSTVFPNSVDAMTQTSTEIAVYPNPFTEEITLTFSKELHGPISFMVYNAIGDLVLNANEQHAKAFTSKRLDLSSLSRGSYFLVIQTADEKKISRIIKE